MPLTVYSDSQKPLWQLKTQQAQTNTLQIHIESRIRTRVSQWAIFWQRTCQIFQTMKHSEMDYLRGIFKWQIRSTDSPRYFAFGLSVRDWRSAEQRSCTVMLMSVALCVWTAAIGSARCWACTSLLHTGCMAARASVSESARAFALTVSWQLEGGGASLHKLSIFCVFCFDVLRANGWNVLFLNARGGHSPLHLFISYFNLNSIVLYLKDLMTVRKLSGSNC